MGLVAGATKPVPLRPDGLRSLPSASRFGQPIPLPGLWLALAAEPQALVSLGLAPCVRLRRMANRPAVVTVASLTHAPCILPHPRLSRQLGLPALPFEFGSPRFAGRTWLVGSAELPSPRSGGRGGTPPPPGKKATDRASAP